MLYYGLYRFSAEAYLLAGALVSPVLCVLGWLLLGRAVSKRLQSYVYWFLPLVIGSSFGAAGVLLQVFLDFFARRDYALGAAVYLLYFASVPFHITWFVRLWKTISALPPSGGGQPQHLEPSADVWPPPPRR